MNNMENASVSEVNNRKLILDIKKGKRIAKSALTRLLTHLVGLLSNEVERQEVCELLERTDGQQVVQDILDELEMA